MQCFSSNLSLFISFSFLVSGYSVDCDIYLRYIQSYGVGVYAGRLFERNRQIENSIGIPIPYEVIMNTELINYTEGLNETHGLLLLGYSSMINSVLNQHESLVKKHTSYEENQLSFSYNLGESYDIVTESRYRELDAGKITKQVVF